MACRHFLLILLFEVTTHLYPLVNKIKSSPLNSHIVKVIEIGGSVAAHFVEV